MGRCKDHNGWNLRQLDNECQLNTVIIINQMEYKEYILVKAVDQILKVRYRKFKHQDGFIQ